METSRLPGPAPQGLGSGSALQISSEAEQNALPAGVSSLRVGEAAGRETEGCGAVPADGYSGVGGRLRSPGPALGSSLLLHTPPGEAARLVFSGGLRLCWAVAPPRCSGRSLAARRLSLSRCIPDLPWSSLSGDFPGEPALGTRLADSCRCRVRLELLGLVASCEVQGSKTAVVPVLIGIVPEGDDSRS